MNDLATIKAQNRIRLEQIAKTQNEAIQQVLVVGDEGAYDKLRNAVSLYEEYIAQDPVR